jgi:hypothetical protein
MSNNEHEMAYLPYIRLHICTVNGAVQIGDCGPVVQPLGHGVA